MPQLKCVSRWDVVTQIGVQIQAEEACILENSPIAPGLAIARRYSTPGVLPAKITGVHGSQVSVILFQSLKNLKNALYRLTGAVITTGATCFRIGSSLLCRSAELELFLAGSLMIKEVPPMMCYTLVL